MLNNELFEHLSKQVELANAVERLFNNPDFKLVVIEQLFHQQALDCVGALASYSKHSDSYQGLVDDLNAISYLQDYFKQVKETGQLASEELNELKLNP